MALRCDVLLDNEHGKYFSGQVVSGSIRLTLHERALIKVFAMKFNGYAGTRWEKPQKKTKKGDENVVRQPEPQLIEYLTNRQDYLSITTYMIGSEDANAKIVDAGTYSYNFSVKLPDVCPPNLETNIGHIRYSMDVYLLYPDKKLSCFARSIQVIKSRDLRTEATQLLQQATIERTEKVPRTKFWQRSLQLHVNIPQIGYVPGERISVYTKLLNDQQLPLNSLIYKLNIVGTYSVQKKKNKYSNHLEKTNILTSEHSLLTAQRRNVFEHLESLLLPDTPPNITHTECNCLQLDYEVEVIVRTTNEKRSISAQLPIVVGTISLQDRQHPRVQCSAVDQQSNGNIVVATAPPPETPNSSNYNMEELATLSASMSSLASSFKEAPYMSTTNLNKSGKHSMAGEQVNFKPKYLYYNMEAGVEEDNGNATNVSTNVDLEKSIN